MSRPLLTDKQQGFDGGMNSVADIGALPPNQFRTCENMRLTTYGALTRRGGSYLGKVIPGAGDPNGLAVLAADDGTPRIVCVSSGDVYVTPECLYTDWTAATGDTLNATAPCSIVKFYDGSASVVYIADGTNVAKLDSSDVVTLLSPSVAVKQLCVHNQRLWAVGSPTAPTSLLYSGINNGDSLGDTGNGGGEIIVRTFGDDKLIGVASTGSSLLIFHERGISRLTGFGQSDIDTQPEGVSRETGLIAPQSIVPVDGGAFCITERGAYFVTDSGVYPLGSPQTPDPILPILLDSAYLDSYSDANQIYGMLRRQTQEIWWYIPGVGIYTYQMVLKAWAGPFTILDSGTDFGRMASGNFNGAGESWREGVVGVFNGGASYSFDEPDASQDLESPGTGYPGAPVNVPWSVQLRRLTFGDDYMAKAFRWLYVTATAGPLSNISVSYLSDLGGGTGQIEVASGGYWDEPTATWDAPGATWTPGGQKSYRVPLGSIGYYLDVTLSSAGGAIPVILSRAAVESFFLGRR